MSGKKRLIIIASSLLLCALLLFAFKNVFANMYLKGKIEKVQNKYRLRIAYDSFKVVGLNTLEVKGLEVNDSLLQLGEANIQFNFLKFLFGKLSISSINAKDLSIFLVKTDSSSNFQDLYKEAQDAENYIENLVKDKTNYEREISKICNLIFNLLPSQASFLNTSISYINPSYSLVIRTNEFRLENRKYSGELTYNENNQGIESSQIWHIEGILNHEKEQITSLCHTKDSSRMQIPFIKYKWHTDIHADTLFFAWENSKNGNETLLLNGHIRINGLSIYHPKIDQETILLAQPSADFKLRVGENFIELDSSSVFSCNGLSFQPYLYAEKNEKWRILTHVNKLDFQAQDLFAALPPSLFSSLHGIETKGSLSYRFLLDIDFRNLDSLKLVSELRSKNFSITKYGNANLSKMAQAFSYTAYDRNVAIKTFELSPAYFYFTPLSQIPPVLQMAILQSEDGGFFQHQGFLQGAFAKALITNIERGRFAKGGSTISMQLVKNVFLSKNKTIARKLEEMLIVWLIENQGLTSKERMFEVYLNIIEWGPGVYGVGEAAKYYFDKRPSQINTEEAIFLASIIPSPKRALEAFDGQGNFRPYFVKHYSILTERLKIKGLLSEEEAINVKAEVKLRKELLRLLEELHSTEEIDYKEEKEL